MVENLKYSMRSLAVLILIIAFYFVYYIKGSVPETVLILSIAGSIVAYVFAKKRGKVRYFLQVALLTFTFLLVVSLLRAISFALSTGVGCTIIIICTYFLLKSYSKKISDRYTISAILATFMMIELPGRFSHFERYAASFPNACFFLLSILAGYLLYKRNGILSWIITIALVVASVFMYVEGYHMWLNKLNYGTFTGKVSHKLSMDYSFFDKDNNIVSLSELKGKIVVLDFWSESCGICRRKFPIVQQLYDTYKDNSDVYITGVCVAYSDGELKRGGDVLRKGNYTYPNLMTTKENPVLKDWSIKGYPFVAILDREGNVIFKGEIEDVASFMEKSLASF